MAPAVIRMPASAGRSDYDNSGIKICCCRIFTCINLNIITSNHGLLKVSEVILGSCCQTMLVRFGIPNAEDIGQAFNSCMTTVSACLLTSTLLLFCYVISTKSFHLIRQSLFEILFNICACFMFMSSSAYMGFTVTFWLYPKFELQRAYMAYPAMTAVYYIGFLLGIIYAIDAFSAYKFYKGFR